MATATGLFDSIVNRGEYFSNHYLDALLQNDLKELRQRWDDAEGRGEPTSRTRLRGLAKPFFAAKVDAAAGEPADHADDVRALHDLVLDALGFEPDRAEVVLTRGDEEVVVPVATRVETHTGLLLLALDLGFAVDLDEAMDPDGAGALLEPVLVDDGKEKLTTGTDAVSYLFACDEPPRYVLLLAGGIVVLADRAKWGEGRYLAVDLDLALSRGDTKARGELETIAALFSADALVPHDGQSVIEQLDAASQKHAVGVSKELREGIRLSVELLANEVIEQRRAAKLGVYEIEGLAERLTKECLRFLYRLLFLLYAEARPELGILPTDSPEYAEGYGLDRLRDLALTPLESERARNGHHLHDSLNLLFRLVNDGYHHDAAQTALALEHEQASDDVGLRFEPLHSELFAPRSTELIDSVKLRNQCLQRVLQLLLLSKEQKGRERGFVSYAQLGINQLGAVYEGLMAYSGFFAAEDLYEVAKPGAADKGTWVIPVDRADELPDEVFVTRPDPETGQPRRVRHEKGSFVFRLSGRDRQRSASYYTPEVLTRCVVKHALAELLDQDGERTPAQRILELTICEPALGSGAFLNEAINQLADEYLRRRQEEVGRTLDPEAFAIERQKVKAHLALHQCYGVDLNATAVELAEVSLWLNAMYPGLQAPWFGLHLRRGNSLVGARRAVYHRDQVAEGAWLDAVPTDRKLADGPIADGEIHHFLLPAHGWGAVADAKQANELRPDEVARLKAWRKAIRRRPSARDTERLVGLAQRVEALWELALQRIRLAEAGLRRPIDVWEAEPTGKASPTTREQVQQALEDPESALARLRLVMDAWCALWFWPIDGPDGMPEPPTLEQWLDALEGLLGIADEPPGQLSLFDDLDDLTEREEQLHFDFDMRSVADVIDAHPWLAEVQRIADREGFWHWELEFAPVFANGGFDLQVGNPPWVRPTWKDDVILAELDPWFGVAERPSEEQIRTRRRSVLADDANVARYLEEVASGEGLNEILGSPAERPLLAGIQTNLYLAFMSTAWRNTSEMGISGLLHPESHFTDPQAGALRARAYQHLRRHWQFINEALLFEEIGHPVQYGIHIYGRQRSPRFLNATNLQLPETLDQSLDHDGRGAPPGLKLPDGSWDRRPHSARVVTIDEHTLSTWARLLDDPNTRPLEARLLRPVTTADLEALEVLANQPKRLADYDYHWTAGFHEKGAKTEGIIRWQTMVPDSWDDVILQGPHFTVATPFAKQPNENCRSKGDYSDWDLEELPESLIPRTNYQRACDQDRFEAGLDHWNGRPSTRVWRLAWRRMTQPGLERSLQAALVPPGTTHVHTVHTLAGPDTRSTLELAALWSTLPFDYLVKVSGKADVQDELVKRFPAPLNSRWSALMALRVLRLACLTREFAPLWEELFDPAWQDDRWTDPDATRPPLGDVGPTWTMETPLRSDYDRRMALVELDALAALALGLTAEQLCAMYRTQFAVLRKYEHAMAFDANGRKTAKDHQAAGVKQLKAGGKPGDHWKLVEQSFEDPGGFEPPEGWIFEPPFTRPDREAEMTRAYLEFQRRLDERT